MKRILLMLAVLAGQTLPVCAQTLGYDETTDLGNGLSKVKSEDTYGIIDNNDNVVVSVEYQDIKFNEGKALLLKDDHIMGVVDTLGNVKSLSGDYTVHPDYPYIYDGYIVVTGKWWTKEKWGYIDEDEVPLRLRDRMKGAVWLVGNFPVLFDEARPFIGGYAAVYIKKTGWKYIDKNGKERYLPADPKQNASFCSSVYNGECIIVTDDGIKLYQENNEHRAVVKKVLSRSATGQKFIKEPAPARMVYEEGVLTLDSLMRVKKFNTGNDSIVFIETPRKTIEIIEEVVKPQPIDTLSLDDDIEIRLSSASLQADAKGSAFLRVTVKNTSYEKFEGIAVMLECNGVKRVWTGDLEGTAEVKVSMNIPARFSALAIKRDVNVTISYKDSTLKKTFAVTVHRYNPVRSR